MLNRLSAGDIKEITRDSREEIGSGPWGRVSNVVVTRHELGNDQDFVPRVFAEEQRGRKTDHSCSIVVD